jgi:hypothetical protein
MQPNSTCCEEVVGSSWPMWSIDFVLCGQLITHDPWGEGGCASFIKNKEPHAFTTYSKKSLIYVLGFQ